MSIASMANATITRVKPMPVASKAGTLVYGDGTAASVRCVLDAPTFTQTKLLAEQIKGATAVAYVPKPASIAIAAGSRLTVAVDGSAAVEYEVVYTVDRQHRGTLSHVESYLKGVR